MEKNILGEKIKNLRNGKGYSQDRLSDLAQISLRTVQRIENGETEARGDTLNRLATALEVGIDELIGTTRFTVHSKGYLMLINLSSLASLFVAIPFFGVLLPLILWQIKKEQMPDIASASKKIINFQITWVLIFIGLYALVMANIIFLHINFSLNFGGLGSSEVMLLAPFVIFVTNAFQVVVNAIRIKMDKELKYWPVIPFLKTN